MPKPPPITPNAIRLSQALEQSVPLARLRSMLQDSVDRLDAIRPLLPVALAPHVEPGPADEAAWSLLAANASVAAKLRQLQPRLEERLRAQGWPACQIRIKVRQP